MSAIGHAHASDADLLARTAEDAEAFGRFYDRFEAEVLAFFRSALTSTPRARVYRSRSSLQIRRAGGFT
jgi:hypothetical protein